MKVHLAPPASTVVGFEIRPPWPDELPRIRHFLPEAFLFGDPSVFVGVSGQAGRLQAVGGLIFRASSDHPAARLYLKIEPVKDEAAWLEALTRYAIDRACHYRLEQVTLGQVMEENSVAAGILLGLGFHVENTVEVHAVVIRLLWERTQRLYRRLRHQKIIPPEAQVKTLLPTMFGRVREFLRQQMSGNDLALWADTSGYKPEHSLVLLMRGEIRGVLLGRTTGERAFVGLRVLAPELCGGFGWANLLLIDTALESALAAGATEALFAVDPDLRSDAWQIARWSGGHRIGRNVLLRWKM